VRRRRSTAADSELNTTQLSWAPSGRSERNLNAWRSTLAGIVSLVSLGGCAEGCDHTLTSKSHAAPSPPEVQAQTASALLPKALRDILPKIREAEAVEVSLLRVVSASEAEAKALTSLDRILGYPLRGSTIRMSSEQAQRLFSVLLDESSYFTDARIRCRNTSLIGVRFVGKGQRLEFALGRPCRQALWAWMGDGRVQRWGALVKEDPAAQIEETVSSVVR
jgi:hypothetical protein